MYSEYLYSEYWYFVREGPVSFLGNCTLGNRTRGRPPSGYAPLEVVPSVAPPSEVVLVDESLGGCDL